MALGTLGSTLNDELNRLANGGTYRDMNQMVDEALAAKQWANRENINPYSTDTVGILNEIAGLGLDKRNWLDFNGVCNYIAGTTGLPAAAALRQVYPTTDLLTGVASYYVDATAPTNWGSLGYVRLNGVAGNHLSIPDSAALDITGDIDIRVRVALDDWTPSALGYFLGKQTSYGFYIGTTGFLNLLWTSDGSTNIIRTSTVATGITDGAVKWVRATLDVDNGSSGHTVTFFTSDNGTSWTQLGDPVITAGTTSVFASTNQVGIGSRGDGGSLLAGNYYRAQILNGIGGTTVLDVNIATDYRSSDQSFFTATTGQTVTVNGVDTIANLGAAGSLLPTTLGSSTAADSNDPKFLDFTGTNYVYLPGGPGSNNGMQVADADALDITGDIDVRIYAALDDWTPSQGMLFQKWNNTSDSWYFEILSNGAFRFRWKTSGGTDNVKDSTVVNTIPDGTAKWVRATLDVDNGASGNDVKFWTSDNGTTWTQLGSTVTTAGVTNVFAGTSPVFVGSGTTWNQSSGKYFRAQVFNGIDGTKVLDVDTSVITAGSATSFTALTGQTVTINRSTSGRKTVAVTQPTWLFGTDDYMEVNNRYMSSGTYLYLPGVASNNASTPDSAAVSITGDIDLRAKVAMDDWTPSAAQMFMSKGAAGNWSYTFYLNTNGKFIFSYSPDGTNQTFIESTAAPTVTDGSTLWVRAVFDVNNGATGNDTFFYTSTDGTTWTQLGTTVTNTGVKSIFDGTSSLEIGTWQGGANPARGKFFRAQVLNGINGTVAFDANFETSITSLLQTSFTESSANAATVTINRSGSAYRSAGITTAGYLYPGATNTFSASATDYLNFAAGQDATVLAITRQWSTPTNFGQYIQKYSNAVGGYIVRSNGTSLQSSSGIFDATANAQRTTGTVTSGSFNLYGFVLNRNTQTLIGYQNTNATASTSTSSVGGVSIDVTPLRIGGTTYQDVEIYAAAVFRQSLTASQIRQISNYFANREVYL